MLSFKKNTGHFFYICQLQSFKLLLVMSMRLIVLEHFCIHYVLSIVLDQRKTANHLRCRLFEFLYPTVYSYVFKLSHT